MKNSILVVVAILVTKFCFAADPSWTHQFESKVEWMKVSASGVLLLSNKEGLHGIDPETKKVAWSSPDVKKTTLPSYKTIPYTTFAILETDEGMKTVETENFSNATFYIINTLDGSVVFNSKTQNLRKVNESHILPELGGIIIECINENKMAAFALVDVESGTIKWQAETGKVSTFNTSPAMGISYETAPRVSADDNILATREGTLYKINAQTGEVIWQKEDAGGTFFTDDEGTTLFSVKAKGLTGGKIEVFAMKLSDGSDVWEKPIVIKATYKSAIPRGKDVIILTGEGFNIYNYKDGSSKFKKPISAMNITDFRELDGGFLVSYSNYIDYIDKETGKSKWKKAIEAAGKDETVSYLTKTSNGMLFISPSLANFFDLEDGVTKLKKDLKLKKDPNSFYDEKYDKYLIYTKKTLYEVDPKSLSFKTLVEELEFDGKEFPQYMELRKDGYFFYSDQNAALVKYDGTVVYNNFFKAPDIGTAGKIGAGLLVAATSVTVSADGGQTSFGAGDVIASGYNQTAGSISPQLTVNNSQMNQFGYDALTKRYKASKETKDHRLVLTDVVVGEEKFVGLVQLNKDNGNVDDKIVLEDKTPMYEIDGATNTLYFVKDGSLMVYEL